MKKNILIIISIFLLLTLSTYIIYLSTQKKDKKNKNKPIQTNNVTTKIEVIDTIEFASSYNLYDLVNIENGTIITNNYEIETNKIGQNKISFDYTDSNDNKQSYTFELNITDSSEPIVFIGEKYVKYVTENFNLCDEIVYIDNYDKDPKCEITGEYNLENIGEYNLKINVSDSNNNVNSKDFLLKVMEDPHKENSTIPYNINDLINKHKNDNTMIGIDVSAWQNEINWEQVKNSNVEFAMIRIGYGYNKNGEIITDKYFTQNIVNAKKAGIKVGIYFYSYAKNEKEAEEQANWVINKLNKETLDLPIAFDWEDWSDLRKYHYNLYDINNVAKTFMETIEKSGYKAMLYGSRNYLTNIWNLPNYSTWLAHYTDETDYKKEYYIWQLSSIGKVNGISGYVDLNILYK